MSFPDGGYFGFAPLNRMFLGGPQYTNQGGRQLIKGL
jgi:hypothetical protein